MEPEVPDGGVDGVDEVPPSPSAVSLAPFAEPDVVVAP